MADMTDHRPGSGGTGWDYVDAPDAPADLEPLLVAGPAYGPAPAPHADGELLVAPFTGRLQPAYGWGRGTFADGTARDEGFAPVEPAAGRRDARSGGYRHSARLLTGIDQAVFDPGAPQAGSNFVDLEVRARQDE
jgi:hypothetical protein